MSIDKPTPDDVEFTKEEILMGKTRTYLAIIHHRNGEEWFIIPDRGVAFVKNRYGKMRCTEPLPFMVREAFWANLTGKANGNGDSIVYISQSDAERLESLFERDMTSIYADRGDYSMASDDRPNEGYADGLQDLYGDLYDDYGDYDSDYGDDDYGGFDDADDQY